MIKKEIDISVVMAVYKNDTALFFDEAIISLFNQTYLPSEIIVVIDGFVNQEIEDVIQKYYNNTLFKIIRLSENKGLANALNVGIKSSKYDFIARMDADDICFPDRFEKQIKYLLKENLDIVGGQIIEFGKNKEDVISERKVPLNHIDMVRFMKLRSPFSHPSILFRKEVFTSLGGYDTIIFPEDYDFFVRAYLGGFKFGNVKDHVLYFRLGENLSEAIKRRWGLKYAVNEINLYRKFLKMGFFSNIDFLKVLFFKIPLRILPFRLYSFIYFKFSR